MSFKMRKIKYKWKFTVAWEKWNEKMDILKKKLLFFINFLVILVTIKFNTDYLKINQNVWRLLYNKLIRLSSTVVLLNNNNDIWLNIIYFHPSQAYWQSLFDFYGLNTIRLSSSFLIGVKFLIIWAPSSTSWPQKIIFFFA